MSKVSTDPSLVATRRRKGQALAEFALTLPILLLLVFGIIEFARLFQTWIVLQSAARAGARAASVGAINYDIFQVPANAQPQDLRVLDAIVPCLASSSRGSKVLDPVTGVTSYNGTEGLFATMYDGTDCDPTNEDHLQLRKDILRIFTVIAAVRETAGTIAVYNDRVDQDYLHVTPANAFDFFKGYWSRPYKSADNANAPGWISIEMCSTRPLLDGTPLSTDFNTRFLTIRNNSDFIAARVPDKGYPQPFCMLNEAPTRDASNNLPAGALDNAGHRWFDVGGPGDRVTVFIKFNHPLITPLNLAQYIFLQSRRSSVNESFRAPKAVGAFQRSIPPGRDDEVTPIPPTDTPEDAIPDTPTDIPDTLTPTATHTPIPFACEQITVLWAPVPLVGSQIYISIHNGNLLGSRLERVRVEWNPSPTYPLMYAQSFALGDNVHWVGTPPSTTPQSVIDTRTNGTFNTSVYRDIATDETWRGNFANGPLLLATAFSVSDFTVEFEFMNPDPSAAPCVVSVERVVPTDPIDTPVPNATPTRTPTPQCGSYANIQPQHEVFFDAFDGSARINLFNSGNEPMYLTGFRLVWPSPTHPDIAKTAGAYFLRRVTVGGGTTTDPASVEVWRSVSATQDAVGNTKTTLPYDIGTTSTNAAEGTWIINAVLVPGNNYMFLDFDGFAGSLYSQMGARSWHFSTSQFFLARAVGCTTGSGGPGTDPTGAAQEVLPSPTRTNTPRPTNPPAPTLTPSRTVPSNTPTKSYTPLPTNTRTNTPKASATPTRTPFGGITATQSSGSG